MLKIYRFTPGQVERALAHLFRYRESLINSPVINNQKIDNTTTLTEATCKPNTTDSKSSYSIGTINVNFNEINNWTTPYNTIENNFYKDYTKNYTLAKTTTNIPYDKPTKLTLRLGDTSNKMTTKVYIDYNNDGVFSETDEVVFTKTEVLQNEILTANITPSSNAVYNKPLRMRVITDFIGTDIKPCNNLRYGDVEDYAVTIVSTLGTDDLNKDKIIIATSKSEVIIKAKDIISNVSITDISGKLIYSGNNINQKDFIKNLGNKNQIYIVVVELKNGEKISKKIIL
ncbi:hypothetical protein HXZ94_15890 [Empedobacter falsenii]|uniref:GEVED domain-containing protein n=1 Tax=Empedobacter falsenii TaxID=343874 RepID=UPI002576DD51|nr:GEVED domain-containing protein [Empedobacter falsenii]MDM1299977.1 hypothetical protein [Empedobacter falsenii]MDM1319753.1 hypothetical protein [Empedobacter falsenii]